MFKINKFSLLTILLILGLTIFESNALYLSQYKEHWFNSPSVALFSRAPQTMSYQDFIGILNGHGIHSVDSVKSNLMAINGRNVNNVVDKNIDHRRTMYRAVLWVGDVYSSKEKNFELTPAQKEELSEMRATSFDAGEIYEVTGIPVYYDQYSAPVLQLTCISELNEYKCYLEKDTSGFKNYISESQFKDSSYNPPLVSKDRFYESASHIPTSADDKNIDYIWKGYMNPVEISGTETEIKHLYGVLESVHSAK